jgi:GTP cyclohydrolase I
MASRGVNTPGVGMVTKHLTGAFQGEPLRQEFLSAAGL